MAELLPCPFCGGEAVLMSNKGAYWVQCVCHKGEEEPMSGCLNGTTVYERHPDIPGLNYDPREKAIEAWNTRTEPTWRDMKKMLGYVTRTCHMERSFTEPSTLDHMQEYMCSACGEYAYDQTWGADVLPNYCPNCGARVIGGSK